MIRVLQFADLVNRYDFIDNIVQRADLCRFEVGVCVRTNQSNIQAPVYSDRTPQWSLNGTRRQEIPRATCQLVRILRDWKADILHAHHFDQAVIGLLATQLYPKARLVIGRHYSDAIYRSSYGWKKSLLLNIERLTNNRAARIVAPSTAIVEILCGRQGVPTTKVDCVPYGFVAEKYKWPDANDVQQFRDEWRLEQRFVIGNFARLHEEKGHRYLIDAIAQLRHRVPELLLLIVGDGPERASIEKQIDDLGLANAVRLLGWRRDPLMVMAAVDAVVQPTLQEAFSQVMAEALWMHKPLVITDVSGASDIIVDEGNGLLIPKGDSGALSRAIARLASSPQLCDQLGSAGRSYVEEHLRIDRVIPRIEEVFLRAVA
ncbi:MAG: glycosyltransferase family 4 protein [Planctomycetes bacterium]|nr:glycosyltransferase family 4 protein [Planctomycetota bacterium]